MNIHQLDMSKGEEWDAFVKAQPEATFFHLSGWGRAIERSFGHKPYYLYAELDDKIQGILPLIHVNSRLFGRALISNAFAVYGGPVTLSDIALHELDLAAWTLAETLGVSYMEYRNRTRLHDDWPCKNDLYVTFRKSLDADNEVNMKAIPRKQRAMVRKGIKQGLKAVIDPDINRFYAMYSESVRNLGTPVFSKDLFINLLREFGPDQCDVLTVEHEGHALSSVLNFYFRGEVLPYYGGGTIDARKYAANDFMYWSVLSRAVDEKACTLFDFGRSKAGTGSYSFKKNWGFDPEPLHYEYRLAPDTAIPDINPLNPKYRLMVNMWKRLPLGVANVLGPMISRNLG